MNRKRGVQSRKQQLAAIITPMANKAKNLSDLENQIKKRGLSPYFRRGMLAGIKDTNNEKYRLRRLGIDLDKIRELTREELRLRELKKLHQKHKERKR